MPNKPNLLGQLKKVLCELDDCGCIPSPGVPPPCPPANLLGQIKNLLNDIDDCGFCSPPCPRPCCPPPHPPPSKHEEEKPFAQVCFTCPPYGLLPTCPTPVKPLEMPCLPGPGKSPQEIAAEEEEDFETRYSSWYNNYNFSYRRQALCPPKKKIHERPCEGPRSHGVTIDGKSPCCDCIPPNCEDEPDPKYECPTGYKPCKFKFLKPPECCNPLGVWKAELEPCPPTYRRKPPKHKTKDGCCCEDLL